MFVYWGTDFNQIDKIKSILNNIGAQTIYIKQKDRIEFVMIKLNISVLFPDAYSFTICGLAAV